MSRSTQALRILYVLTLFVMVSASAMHAQSMRKVEYRGALHQRGDLRIWNTSGSIQVTGWDRDSVVVRGSVPADQHFSCGGGEAGLKCAVDLAARYDGTAPGSTLEIMVPRRIQLWIKSSSAEIMVTNFDGSLDAYSVSGRIRATGNAQTVAIESMSGRVEVLANAVTLRAKTAGGDINIKGEIEDAQVTSVSGNIGIAGSRVQRGKFESISGQTTWQGDLAPRASLEFGSHDGAIELKLPGTTAGEFSISTFEGTVRSDFGPRKLVHARDLKNRELHVALPGDDDARITIRNFKGPISLLKY